MKNSLQRNYLSVAIISLTLLGTVGCTKDPTGNHPPVVQLIENKIVKQGEMVHLTAHVSDVDKDELSHLWTIIGHPQGSAVSLRDNEKTSIAFRADKSGIYKLNFTTTDDIASSQKIVTVTTTSIVGEWKADLAKTKEKNRLNETQRAEVIETLSAKYKFKFLENGEVQGKELHSWKYNKNGNYLTDGEKKIKLINSRELYLVSQLKDGKEVKFYYKRVVK